MVEVFSKYQLQRVGQQEREYGTTEKSLHSQDFELLVPKTFALDVEKREKVIACFVI